MPDTSNAKQTPAPETEQRLLALFTRLLPLLDSLTGKLRWMLLLGFVSAAWITVWLALIKHFALSIALTAGGLCLLPLLILLSFWWALEELKDLPAIAGQMLGDAKNGMQMKIADIRAGNMPKLGLLGATKGLWSVGSMLLEARELFGSYLSIAALMNPLMLILGILSLVSVIGLISISVVLTLFSF